MDESKLAELRVKVSCSHVLEQAGFALDFGESTRKAMKFRRRGEIIIVIHDGRGWFDPLGDGKGDVFDLVESLRDIPFVKAVNEVASLVGFTPLEPIWQRGFHNREPGRSIPERWHARHRPWRNSATWHYLRDKRGLPDRIIRVAVSADLLREGPRGSMWAAHTGTDGGLTGWEERGASWRGFASGGSKVLFRLGWSGALRLCVTEAAIDALSLAALEGMREDSLYLSAGGGWSAATSQALRLLATRPGAQLVAATDADSQGEAFAGRLRKIAEDVGCDWLRRRPPTGDWNDALYDWKAETKESRKRKTGLPHARRPRQG
jgi:hypothetical protein